jgi:hypothetical protein
VPYSQLNNLDYLEIKENLKTYLRTQTDFTDYDFEGSALSNILDVLSYNTYYTAFNTNLIANEFFIESASIRDNVVRIAKQLGYRPRSKVAPAAKVDFVANITDLVTPSSYTLRKGTGFVTNFENSLYNYVVIDDVTTNVSNGVAEFTDVEIYEGSLVTEYFTYTEQKSNRIILSNADIDVSTIRVNVRQSKNSTAKTPYNPKENILDVKSTDQVYFVEEVDDERYEIIFGDGVFGSKLEAGNYIEVSYLVTNGPVTNGVKNFRFNGVLSDSDNIQYTTTVSVTNVIEPSDGGADIESINEIKFIAPKYFSTQDRAVTASDFKPIVSKIYPNVSDIIVYGGEDESPPEYGVVKIIIKPKAGSKLTSFTKKQITNELKQYMIASVTPVIIDPSILYVEITSRINYKKILTNLTSKDIKTKVIDNINLYLNQSDTEKFSGKLRYSKINSVIDQSDESIQSNLTSFTMRKDFSPILNTKTYYEICFQNKFDKDCEGATVSSTGFTVFEYPLFTVYLKDIDGKMVLYRIGSDGNHIILNNDVGVVNYETGEIKIYDLTVLKGTLLNNTIQIRSIPHKKDIFATREQYLDVDIDNSKFIAEVE